jgi:hypothetical protein
VGRLCTRENLRELCAIRYGTQELACFSALLRFLWEAPPRVAPTRWGNRLGWTGVSGSRTIQRDSASPRLHDPAALPGAVTRE